jgi:hypothetical protein
MALSLLVKRAKDAKDAKRAKIIFLVNLYLLSHGVIASVFCEAIPKFSVEIASSAQNASSQ